MSRFIEASPRAYEIMEEVKAKHFPYLDSAIIKILFDTRMRKKGGKMVLGRMLKANDLIRRLTDNLSEDGCDYVMFLDQVAFENISDDQRTRLVRHELRHCKVTGEVEEPKYNIMPHDLEDFTVECELNKDNVGWARDVAQLAFDIYEQRAEDKKSD